MNNNNNNEDQIAEYLANGGKITTYPPGKTSHHFMRGPLGVEFESTEGTTDVTDMQEARSHAADPGHIDGMGEWERDGISWDWISFYRSLR